MESTPLTTLNLGICERKDLLLDFFFSGSKILQDVINAEESLRPAEALEMCRMLEIINL